MDDDARWVPLELVPPRAMRDALIRSYHRHSTLYSKDAARDRLKLYRNIAQGFVQDHELLYDTKTQRVVSRKTKR